MIFRESADLRERENGQQRKALAAAALLRTKLDIVKKQKQGGTCPKCTETHCDAIEHMRESASAFGEQRAYWANCRELLE